ASRKFWAAVAGFVTAVLLAFNVNNLAVEQAAAIIAAVGVLVAYILGESYVDGKRQEEISEKTFRNTLGDVVHDIVLDMKEEIFEALQEQEHENQDDH
ncbi:MAG: hypothetical protein FWF15_11635, partial [Oscillospiraceae bacterium]|nr:hypothetical protein [Oscillospiraceae bacterium]